MRKKLGFRTHDLQKRRVRGAGKVLGAWVHGHQGSWTYDMMKLTVCTAALPSAIIHITAEVGVLCEETIGTARAGAVHMLLLGR
ncbi:Frequency clock protein [Fusarium oxysporum f. sp. albedinis]|nr:Frequency clock protein [Fusarium oxysporum f. sp. albedinis]